MKRIGDFILTECGHLIRMNDIRVVTIVDEETCYELEFTLCDGTIIETDNEYQYRAAYDALIKISELLANKA